MNIDTREILFFAIPIENFHSELSMHIENIIVFGYELTGRKFSVTLNGSKGYISNIEVSCEGEQKGNNCIDITDFPTNGLNTHYTGKDMALACFYSESEGVRLEILKIKECQEISKNQ